MFRAALPLLLSSFTLSPLVFAEETPAVPCLHFLHQSQLYQINDMKNELGKSAVRVTSAAGSFDLIPPAPAFDAVIDGDSAYILTKSTIEKWSLQNRVLEQSWELGQSLAQGNQVYAAALAHGKIFIAHGRGGVLVFDTAGGAVVAKFANPSSAGGLESSARGVTVQGDRVYVAIDSFSLAAQGKPQPFAGIVVYDAKSAKKVSELKGFDPGVTSIVGDGDDLFVSFAGDPIWVFKQNSIDKAVNVLPTPVKRAWQFPDHGHPSGHGVVDGHSYTGCYSFNDGVHQFYKKKIVSYTYEELGLK
ncbi:MAG: hypothetical protein H7249_08565 [Chitinophagaceae bacterium]|nr:hypothetical protein [Oligoflexus sp.]